MQKNFKQLLHHHMFFGRVSRKNILAHPTTYSVVRHNWKFKWDWLLWSDIAKKNELLAANTQDVFGEHRDKKYPMCTMKYTVVFFMLWAYFTKIGSNSDFSFGTQRRRSHFSLPVLPYFPCLLSSIV